MSSIVCRECGTPNRATTEFCIECGTGIGPCPSRARRASRTAAPAVSLSSVWAFFNDEGTGQEAALRTAAIALLIFSAVFLSYYLSVHAHPEPGPSIRWIDTPGRCCMSYADLADALIHGTLDLNEVGIQPKLHFDLVKVNGKVYLPYQPMPAVLLIPMVATWGTGLTQLTFSMMLGAVNVVLFWYMLRLLGASRSTKLLLLPFFAFGTVHFYAATTGSLWFYNHVTAVFFLLGAIILLIRRDPPVLVGLCIGAAALSRQSVVLAVPAFLYYLAASRYPAAFTSDLLQKVRRDRELLINAGTLLAILVPFGIFSLWYNDVRFGGVFDTGLDEVYDNYNGVDYTQYLAAGGERFAEFDLRNIPIHLYTIFLQPPEFSSDGSLLRPSPFGMSVLLTSTPLIYSVVVKRRDPLKTTSWIALAMVPLPTLLYYSGGWVQFGYRYILDYLPFLMVLTIFGFEDNQSKTSFRIKVALVVLSIAIGFWGRYWGTRLGW